MRDSLEQLIDSYDSSLALDHASTIPSSWYTDSRIFELEKVAIFSRAWQVAARADQLSKPGDYVTTEIADEPIVVVRGSDNRIHAFFNACRHHAAAVMTEPQGNCAQLRCPYHGWTYSLEGHLKGTPDFTGVCDFDRTKNGLVPVGVAVWDQWVFVRIDNDPSDKVGGPRLPPNNEIEDWFGAQLTDEFRSFYLNNLKWFERRSYTIECNWKAFVDNYLDGGYHVPHLHKDLDSVLDYPNYTIECGQRHCLQSSRIVNSAGGSPPLNENQSFGNVLPPATKTEIGSVRTGERALYYWIYPNFMINCYEGLMDTNLVRPITVDKTEVVFDFYFTDVSEAACERNRASISVADKIQQEDLDICASVQRGLKSRAYEAGRLSVRREAGEHLFHRLLYADLKAGFAAATGC